MLLVLFAGTCRVEIQTLPNAYVKVGRLSTYTDQEGRVILNVSEGDTVHVYHVGYRDTSLVLTCSKTKIALELEPSEYMFPEVVVEKTVGENVSTRPVRAVRREEVLYPSGLTMRPDDALENIPGVVFVGKDPTASVPAVRGLAFFRTLVVLDFVRLSTEREIGPSLFFAPVGVVRAVEVAEGGSVPFGSDAMGGTVMYLLKGVGDPDEFSLHLRSNQPNASVYVGHSPVDSLYVGVATSLSGDYTYPDTLRSNGFWGSGSLKAPSSNRKFGTILEVRRWGTSLKAALFSTRDFYRAYTGTMYYPDMDHVFLLFGSRFLSAGYHGYTVLARKVKEGKVKDNLRRGRDVTLRFQFDRGGLHVGASYFGRMGVTSSVFEDGRWLYDEMASATVHDAGLFLFGDYRVGNVLLSGGGRVGLYTASNVKGWRVIPSFHVGGRFPLRDVVLSVNLETSYRFPTLTESSSRSPHPRGFILGNPDLNPERGISGDFGLKLMGDRVSFEALAFATAINDYVDLTRSDTLTPEGDSIFYYTNVPGRTVVLGMETILSVNLFRNALRLSYTHLNGKAGDRVVSGIIPSVLKITWEYEGRFKPYVKGEYRPAIEDVAVVEVPRPSFFLLNFGIRGKVLGAEVDGGISNVNNAVAYRTLNPKSLPLPGRGVYLNLRRVF